MTGPRGAGTLDAESQAMIYHGLNMSQLCNILRMDHRTLRGKLEQGNIKPSGKRAGYDIYMLHEILPWVVKPMYEIEEHIKRMNHNDLPKALTKEFWAGQRSKQEFLLKEGDLWPTEQVVERVGELLKLVKMSALLMADAVDRTAELTPKQRDLIKSLTDGMLTDLANQMRKNFDERKREPANEKTEVIEEDEDDL